MSDVVLFEELDCDNGKKIGFITLNSPKSLNALSGAMIDLLYPQLLSWQQQANIAAVFIQGEGEKAFCAGGDIVHLYQAMNGRAAGQSESSASLAVEQYFTREYQLDYLIHTFNKPVLVWGSGIVMGGGLGLMAGASHRVVTETSRIAMPEISIGLFPDVGASYFLNKMPTGCGLFLALTGASINAGDAKYCSLADHFVETVQKSALLTSLTQVNWGDTVSLNHEKLTMAIQRFEQQALVKLPKSVVADHQSLITQLTSAEDINSIVANILSTQLEDKWFNRAQDALRKGSALSAHLAYKQLRQGRGIPLSECFKMELTLAVRSGQFGEFKEGVRALLIDKDNQPSWRFEAIDKVDKSVVEWFFDAPWSKDNHPLASLGANA